MSKYLKYPRHECEFRHTQEITPDPWKKIKRLFFISDKNWKSYWYLRSKGAIQLELIRQQEAKDWYTVHPFSMLRLCWEILMLTILSFALFFLPFRIAFLNSYVARYYVVYNRPLDDILTALTIELCFSVIWVIDMLGNFITGYYDEERGKVIMDRKKIFRNYFVPGFLIDLSCSVPLDYMIVKICGIKYYSNTTTLSFLGIVSYNIYTIIRYRGFLKYIKIMINHSKFPLLSGRILLSIFMYIWILNWTICFTFVVTQLVVGEELFKNKVKKKSWIQFKFFNMTLQDQYIVAVLRGLNDNVGAAGKWATSYAPEDYLIAVFISILGRVYWVYFTNSFLEAITAAHILKVKFSLIMVQFNNYMKEKELPSLSKKRLNRFYLYRFQARYFRDRSLLAKLPESLRKEICMYTCQRLIYNTQVFASVPKPEMTRLVQRMTREMYFPNDVIIQGNTFGDCMYFICSGIVSVSTISGKEICQLQDGDLFGEIALIIPERRRTATVTAVTITEVYRLESGDFKQVIEVYPDVYFELEKIAVERYQTTVSYEEKEVVYRKTEPG